MIPTIFGLGSKHWPWKWALVCDYCPPLVQAFKKNLPRRQYKWRSDVKEWWFDDSTVEMAAALVERHLGPVRHTATRPETISPPTLPADLAEAYQALFLLPSAPPAVVTAAYKALAKMTHPDHGGATETMQALNSAYERIGRESGWRGR